jgi:hypothetical protein
MPMAYWSDEFTLSMRKMSRKMVLPPITGVIKVAYLSQRGLRPQPRKSEVRGQTLRRLDHRPQQLLAPHVHSRTKDGRRVRALDISGKDRELLQAISDPAFTVSGGTAFS